MRVVRVVTRDKEQETARDEKNTLYLFRWQQVTIQPYTHVTILGETGYTQSGNLKVGIEGFEEKRVHG